MSDLIEFRNIADEITIREDGVPVVTIRGGARLAGKDEKALRYHLSGAEKIAQNLLR